jgi:ubiquinone/menaquinone biosynthesis C-methylase UbiE
MHERRFSGDIKRLRSTERVERLEVGRVIRLCLEGVSLHSVLDVGTGSGLFAEQFAQLGLRVTGVDANPVMLPLARGFVPGGSFVQATEEALPFAPGAFELSFLGLVLHEADDPLKSLQGARRVSSKRVCLLEWPYRAQSFGPPLVHRLSPKVLEDLFRQAGFSSWEHFGLDDTVLYLLECSLPGEQEAGL